MSHELYPIEPKTAVERYLNDRANEVQDQTLKSHEYRLKHFVRWCGIEGIENLNELRGKHLQEYRYWRKKEGDLNNVTLHTQITTFRVFINWCEDTNAVVQDLSQKVRVPQLKRHEDVRDEFIEAEMAEELLNHLSTFEYASNYHTMFRLMWRIGARIGGIHALDLDDYDSDEQAVQIRHRPESDTPLKNGEDGERDVFMTEQTCQVIDDFIETSRSDVVDDYGREPLFTTSHGRAHTTTLRSWVYRITRPCFYSGECPHDREIETCEANENWKAASKCPSTHMPHEVRKGSITYWLNRGTPEEIVGQRMNVSSDVLGVHYDKRTEREKMNSRKDFFNRE